MPMHIAELITFIIFLYMKIFVCLLKQACLLAIISKLGGGVGILWLRFAQQQKNVKCVLKVFKAFQCFWAAGVARFCFCGVTLF
jgi:hypothetical protein